MLWSGTIETIPEGWHLCDGTHGTPDMRDQFSLSAGPIFRARTSGGTTSHVHDFTADGHFHDLRPFPLGPSPGTLYDSTTDTIPIAGQSASESHIPIYYSLAFIMRLPD